MPLFLKGNVYLRGSYLQGTKVLALLLTGTGPGKSWGEKAGGGKLMLLATLTLKEM